MQISSPGMEPVLAQARAADAADVIEAGEIGSRDRARAPSRRQSLRRLLSGDSIRDAVLAAELLRPPKALRQQE